MVSDVSLPDLGRRLSAARLQRGYSQGTVARLAGVAPSYLSRIENGKIHPTFRTVLRLLRALHADVEEILEPGALTKPHHLCPVSHQGRCLLDLIRSETSLTRGGRGESYTPRQIRLLRRLASWMQTARADRLRAMEILLDELLPGMTTTSPPKA